MREFSGGLGLAWVLMFAPQVALKWDEPGWDLAIALILLSLGCSLLVGWIQWLVKS